MEPKVFLLCSQELASVPYPEPDVTVQNLAWSLSPLYRSVLDCVKTSSPSLLSLLCLHTYDRLNHNIHIYGTVHSKPCGPGSSVGIVTDYGLDGLGSNPGAGRDFPPVQTGPGAHPASCKMGTVSFPGVKCVRGVLLTTNPLLVPRSWKIRAVPLPPSGPHRAYNGITLPLPFT